ncbi:MAG: chemotaxis protein CheC [Actinobacteria bacterium]|nr:chemotaxis protein CheC [Actinomycetota bacterium]
MEISKLTELQLDAIREIGSIGAGHAATALSQLTGKQIDISVPSLEIVPCTEVPQVFGGPERLVGAVYARILGDISGNILFMVDRESSLALVDLMRGRTIGTARTFGHEEERQVTHTASVLIAAYIASIARLTDMDILPSSPMFALDMAGAILQVAALEASLSSDQAILVRTRFSDEGTSVDGAPFFLPDSAGLEVILGRLGVK